LKRIREVGWLDVITSEEWRERHTVRAAATNWQMRQHLLRVWLLLLVHIVDVGRPERILSWDAVSLRVLHPSPLVCKVFFPDLACLLFKLLLFLLASPLLTL